MIIKILLFLVIIQAIRVLVLICFKDASKYFKR